MKSPILFLLILGALCGCRSKTYEQSPEDNSRRVRYVDGRWDGGSAPSRRRPRQRIDSNVLIQKGKNSIEIDPEEASKILKNAYDQAGDRETAQKALYLSAESALKARLLRTSYRRFLVLIDTFPQTDFYPKVLENLFLIGKLGVDGEAINESTFSWFGDSSQEFGAKVLHNFAQDYDRHPKAPEAYHLYAKHLANSQRYDVAIQAWTSFLDSYSDSPLVPRVEYEVAKAKIAFSEDEQRDQRLLLEALDGLRTYSRKYPKGDDIRKVLEDKAALEGKLAAQELAIAKAYRYNYRWGGFQVYLEHILQEFPATQSAKEARELYDDFIAKKAYYTNQRSWREYISAALGGG